MPAWRACARRGSSGLRSAGRAIARHHWRRPRPSLSTPTSAAERAHPPVMRVDLVRRRHRIGRAGRRWPTRMSPSAPGACVIMTAAISWLAPRRADLGPDEVGEPAAFIEGTLPRGCGRRPQVHAAAIAVDSVSTLHGTTTGDRGLPAIALCAANARRSMLAVGGRRWCRPAGTAGHAEWPPSSSASTASTRSRAARTKAPPIPMSPRASDEHVARSAGEPRRRHRRRPRLARPGEARASLAERTSSATVDDGGPRPRRRSLDCSAGHRSRIEETEKYRENYRDKENRETLLLLYIVQEIETNFVCRI